MGGVPRPSLGGIAVALLVAAAIAPGVAVASTASTAGGDELRYTAAAGETNNVTIAREPTLYRITDPTVATITPMAPCAAVSATEVTCPAVNITRIEVTLNDLDDSGTLAASVTNVSSIFFNGGAGNDTLNGGNGEEASLSGEGGNDVLNAGAAGDRMTGAAGDDTLIGGPGNDGLDPGPGTDLAVGNAGEDSFQGGSTPDGADILSGGPGLSDELDFRRDTDVTLTFDGNADDGGTGEGDNVMPDFEQVSTGAGNDVVRGGDPGERIFTAGGDDSISGGAGGDQIFGDAGTDALSGDGGDDELSTGPGTDTADGGEGDDLLQSSSFIVGADDGADVLAGGPGSDLFRIDSIDSATVTLDGVADDGVAGEGDNVMADVENAETGDRADTIVGNASANQLDGGAGDDLISGLGGSDGLAGERGNDSLDGGEGNDLVEGASGADRLRTRDGDADEAACGAGVDAVLADARDNAGADCEADSTGITFAKRKAKVSDSGKASVRLECPAAEEVDCDGKLTLKKGKRKLGSKRFRIDSGEEDKVKVKVGSPGGGKLTAEAIITDAAGEQARSSAKLKLVRKGGS